MIAGTYIVSGLLLIVTAILFKNGTLTATTQTACWCVIFFFASAGASSAYLTVSEIFPMETRAMAIAFFYAVGTALGGITGPLLFGKLIEHGQTSVTWGYILGASLMIAAGLVEVAIGGGGGGTEPREHRQAADRAGRRGGGDQGREARRGR